MKNKIFDTSLSSGDRCYLGIPSLGWTNASWNLWNIPSLAWAPLTGCPGLAPVGWVSLHSVLRLGSDVPHGSLTTLFSSLSLRLPLSGHPNSRPSSPFLAVGQIGIALQVLNWQFKQCITPFVGKKWSCWRFGSSWCNSVPPCTHIPLA